MHYLVLLTYATYDLTNLQLEGFTIKIVIIDLYGGTTLGTLTSTLTYLIYKGDIYMINNIIYKNNLYNAIINGAKAVINQERYLNEINVFPVKDADTGSNMTSLMKSILERSKIEETLKDTLESISNAALIGSKGNSGIIFSQFIYGFTKDIKDEYIDDINLVKQLEKGYNYAYKAIDKPVEGTMITLMRSLYEILNLKKAYL